MPPEEEKDFITDPTKPGVLVNRMPISKGLPDPRTAVKRKANHAEDWFDDMGYHQEQPPRSGRHPQPRNRMSRNLAPDNLDHYELYPPLPPRRLGHPDKTPPLRVVHHPQGHCL
jgi:hypothetical protein